MIFLPVFTICETLIIYGTILYQPALKISSVLLKLRLLVRRLEVPLLLNHQFYFLFVLFFGQQVLFVCTILVLGYYIQTRVTPALSTICHIYISFRWKIVSIMILTHCSVIVTSVRGIMITVFPLLDYVYLELVIKYHIMC